MLGVTKFDMFIANKQPAEKLAVPASDYATFIVKDSNILYPVFEHLNVTAVLLATTSSV